MPVIINGTTGVSGADGSASAPSIQGNDTNTGVFFPAADTVAIATGGSERVRADSSGNVGIGITPSAWSGAQVVQLGARGGLMYRVDLTSTELSTNSYYNSGVGYVYQASAAATLYRQSSGAHSWFNASSGTAGNVVGYTQAMTLDASGNFFVGKTGANDNTNGFAVYNIGASIAGALSVAATTSDNTSSGFRQYSTGAGAYRFYVGYGGTINATSTSISAISDESLKENIRDLETGLTQVLALRPRRFDWKEETKIGEKNVAGFVAQEVEQVLPELVYDYQYSENVTKKSLKMGDILPTLVKAIQEQQALITSLTARIAALEGAAQ